MQDDSKLLLDAEEQESIERVRAVLDEEARGCPDLADLWDGWSEDLRKLATGEPFPVDDLDDAEDYSSYAGRLIAGIEDVVQALAPGGDPLCGQPRTPDNLLSATARLSVLGGGIKELADKLAVELEAAVA